MPTHGPPAVPSRNALRTLRRLALAGSTVGSCCTVAAITYDVHRRVGVAERIVENKRALQSSAPRYDATSAARRLSRMMDAAEAGEFMGLEAWKEEERKFRKSQILGSDCARDENPPDFSVDSKSANSFDDNTTVTISHEAGVSRAGIELNQSSLNSGNKASFPPSRPPEPPLKSRNIGQEPELKTYIGTVESDLGNSAKKQKTLTENMEELFERGDYINAAQIFLDAHPASLKGISSERRELATQAFFLNCRQDNVFIARSVFERLEEVDRISPTMWRILIVTLAKKGCIESAATIYMRYRGKFSVPGVLLDVVLRCLVESRRLTSAKWVLLRNLSKDRDCGLCGAYLSGLWKKTRNIELLNGQFTKLLMVLRRLDKAPTEKLVNPLLKAYVEFGRFSDAEALVHQMTTTYRVPLTCRMKGLLVYGKALQCDWAAVDEGLQEMHKLGLTSKKRDFVYVFDRIFLEYWPSHTCVEIQDFLYRYIDKFDINADRVFFQHIMEAIVEKGDEAMVSEFTSMARQRGWKVKVDEKAFIELLRNRRSALEDSPVGFWQMLRVAREENMRATASQQLLGQDRRSFLPVTNNLGAQFPDAWYKRTVDELTKSSRPVDQFQKLHHQMIYYMHMGKMAEALQCFQGAKYAGFHFKPLEVELAVIATLLEHGPSAAQTLLEGQWTKSLPIFYRQIKDLDPSAEDEVVKLAVFRFYKICWLTRRMVIKHNITASTSRRLIASNKPELALDLLVTVYTSKYGRLKEFDAVCIKMFLRAFTATNNFAGMRWCILTAISRGSALSRDLAVEVDRVLGIVRREDTSSEKKIQLRYLDFAASVLHGKCNGDPKYSELGGNAELKKSFRRRLKGYGNKYDMWRGQAKLFKQAIEEWDEEYELEKVLRRIDNDESSILAQWDEAACVELESVNGL
ncbi:pentatricopeptide repeat protein [Aspergillus puulaauensis]|uniref:Pentatricopeptide repeat protein n=1 Tax=Aspergillus puulaauensis TaxID=1220207 RepID=A0A7R7XY01_9EURO|nr:uncharacterized protein APUU_80115S [Aspergillus puulaauensis]BCS29812.1 hypothetical protein APUU_80115S [Aspergillus puulaauensis]